MSSGDLYKPSTHPQSSRESTGLLDAGAALLIVSLGGHVGPFISPPPILGKQQGVRLQTQGEGHQRERKTSSWNSVPGQCLVLGHCQWMEPLNFAPDGDL